MSKTKQPPVLTAKVCRSNAEQFPDILRLYVAPGSKVLDTTYGNGVFWKLVPPGDYKVTKNDLDQHRGTTHHDATHLPARWRERFDCAVVDFPYLGVGGVETLKDSIDKGYKNRARAARDQSGIGAVRRLYAQAICEAWRVLRRSGILILKVMDQVESGQQNFLSNDVMELCSILGFRVEDELIYVSKNTPTMRHEHQIHARRNHSSWVVARRRP